MTNAPRLYSPPLLKKELPGTISHQDKIAEIIRVDQAGEYGAKQIYAGQRAILGNSAIGPALAHMAEQEEAHLAYFNEQLVKRKVRPTLLQPVWKLAGFALGAATALLGQKAAMACTVAIEEVIDAHYQEQLDYLQQYADEKPLRETIQRFQAEEVEHRDTGLAHRAEDAPAYPLLTLFVKTASRLAIGIAKKI